MKKISLIAATLLVSTANANAATFTVNASFTPNYVATGQSTTFNWSAPLGSFCEVEGLPGGTRFGRSGSLTFAATASLTAHVSCERMDTFSGKSATLTVANSSPTVTSKFTPSTVYVGSNGSTYSWNSTLASNCSSPQNPAIAGTSGSIAVPATASPSQQTYTVTCSSPNGSASNNATLTTAWAPPPAPTVTVFATPDYLYYGGYVDITFNATNYSTCTGQGQYYVSRSTNFYVTCTGPGGSATGYTWVTVQREGEVPMFASMSTAGKNGKQAAIARTGAPADLKHLGIDLAKKRYAYAEGDFNKDGATDLLVVDKLKEQLHVVLGKAGQYPAISKTVDSVSTITQVKGLFVPVSNNPGEIRVTVQSQQ